MIQTKQTDEAPEAVTLVVRFEGVVCTSPTGEEFNSKGMSGGWVVD